MNKIEKLMVRSSEVSQMLSMSARAFKGLRESDASFPKPVKTSQHRQAVAFFVVSEVEAWLKDKIEQRNAELLAELRAKYEPKPRPKQKPAPAVEPEPEPEPIPKPKARAGRVEVR